MTMMTSLRNRSPFSPAQWRELEHQALIFKYMASGVPIPSDLILSVKRSLEYSSMPSNLFSRQPTLGWGSFQRGFGRKADPEPGRCRRTDGKKWRCSKEACPDSKYCERHMQRGRNRSRKPMELVTTAPNSSSTNQNFDSNLSPTLSSYSLSTLSPSMSTSETNISHQQPHHNLTFHPSYPPSSYSRPPPTSCLMPQSNIDSYSSSQADLDSRYVHETKDGVNERNFFPEDSWTLRSLPDQYPPLALSCSNGYSQLHYQTLTDHNSQHQKQQLQHCFVLGTDFKSPTSAKVEREEETGKPFHHFFQSCLDMGENQTNHASFSAAQLSVSTPLSTKDLFSSKSTFGTDG